jgi:hypothetical protein
LTSGSAAIARKIATLDDLEPPLEKAESPSAVVELFEQLGGSCGRAGSFPNRTTVRGATVIWGVERVALRPAACSSMRFSHVG